LADHLGDLTSLPLDDDSIDLAVCALALTHLALQPAIAELVRVVRPGGKIVISDVHPQFVGLGANALEVVVDGRRRFIRNHVHPHSSYIAAFIANGLVLCGCHEPTFDDAAVELVAPPWLAADAVAAALSGLPAILAWELQAT
jgi:ubiquinone/menaquinone biosynthesis C-methylase UbiE